MEVGDGETRCPFVLSAGRIADRVVARSGVDPTAVGVELHAIDPDAGRRSRSLDAMRRVWRRCARVESRPPDHTFPFEGLAAGGEATVGLKLPE